MGWGGGFPLVDPRGLTAKQLQLLHRHTPIAPEVSASQRPLAYLVPRWLWDVPLTQGKVLFLALAS